jgi:hypothetical protein
MSYRSKTFVAFASEDLQLYKLMETWREKEHINFSFFDAHDLRAADDPSEPETLKARLRDRLKTAEQAVLIGSPTAKSEGGDGSSFLSHEVEAIIEANLPVVIANHDGDRGINLDFIPQPFLDADYFTMSVSFQPVIVQCALDDYTSDFADSTKQGPRRYKPRVYEDMGL